MKTFLSTVGNWVGAILFVIVFSIVIVTVNFVDDSLRSRREESIAHAAARGCADAVVEAAQKRNAQLTR